MKKLTLGKVNGMICSRNGIVTTNFFGGHLFPQSADECIVDGIALVIIAIGMAVGGDKP